MTAYRHGVRVLTGLTIALMVVACDVESSRPTPTAPTTPVTPAPPSIVRIQLTGPSTVNLGETVQYTATGIQSDGGSRDVTATAQWSSNSTFLASAGGQGRFTGIKAGESSVSAAISRISATMGSVVVVPEGTFRIKGTIRDAGVPVDARLRIENSALGRVDMDTVRGAYAIYGIAGPTRITVNKSGYEEVKRDETITSHRIIDVDLALSGARPDLAGTYTLTLTADGSCSSLPDDLRSRTYTATIQQAGPQLTVTLSGPEFVSSDGRQRNMFTGFVEADRAAFSLTAAAYYGYLFYFFPDILEIVGPNRYYALQGDIVVSVSRNVLSGAFAGTIAPFIGPPIRPGPFNTWCTSNNHRVVFTR